MADVSRSGECVFALRNLRAGYVGEAVVHDVSLDLHAGRITTLFGHNGAGKTTTMKAAAGLLPMLGGRLELFGVDVTSRGSSHRVAKGLFYLGQERAVFGKLSVRDNLTLGAALVKSRSVIAERIEQVVALFPILAERMNQTAGSMSGGQQRMLALGIARMAGARVLMLDEPSLGLSPIINQRLLDATQQLAREQGIAVLLVEQTIGQALQYADHVYVMRSGSVVAEHTGDEARAREDWWEVF
ncbi:MAG: transporter ATP-binding protein [Frankiales bacterium]|jgi:branched-chain amino acid transport system ATP-binding protein|nr:transporter ATP-binding protein [Frankiales bacterium]